MQKLKNPKILFLWHLKMRASTQQRLLPRTFAVFNDRETQRAEFAIFRVERDAAGLQSISSPTSFSQITLRILHVEVLRGLDLTSRFNVYETDRFHDGMFEIEPWRYWETGIYLNSQSDSLRIVSIPVLDFEDRTYFQECWADFTKANIYPNGVEVAIANQMRQRTVRMRALEILVEDEMELMLPLRQDEPRTPPVPLRRQMIEQEFHLPRRVADALIRDLLDRQEHCAITTEPFSQCNEIAITPCFHYFQKRALEQWLSSHSTCPECRGNITSFHTYLR